MLYTCQNLQSTEIGKTLQLRKKKSGLYWAKITKCLGHYNIREMSELPRDQSVKDNPDNGKEPRIALNQEMHRTEKGNELIV